VATTMFTWGEVVGPASGSLGMASTEAIQNHYGLWFWLGFTLSCTAAELVWVPAPTAGPPPRTPGAEAEPEAG
jgi:hypothetical protein